MTVVEWLLLGALLLLFALVLVQIKRANKTEEDLIVLRRGVFERDPDYWGERLGYDLDLPVLNDEPELGPPDCEEQGGFHVADDRGGKTCLNCPAVLKPAETRT